MRVCSVLVYRWQQECIQNVIHTLWAQLSMPHTGAILPFGTMDVYAIASCSVVGTFVVLALVVGTTLWWNRRRRSVLFVGVPLAIAQCVFSALWAVAHAAVNSQLPGIACHEWALLVVWVSGTLAPACLLWHLGTLIRAFAFAPGFGPYIGYFSILPAGLVAMVAALGGSAEVDVDACSLTPHGKLMVLVCSTVQGTLLLFAVHEARAFQDPYPGALSLFGAWILSCAGIIIVLLFVLRDYHPPAVRFAETLVLCLSLAAFLACRTATAMRNVACGRRRVVYLPLPASPVLEEGEGSDHPTVHLPPGSRRQSKTTKLFVRWLRMECPELLRAYSYLWATFCSSAGRDLHYIHGHRHSLGMDSQDPFEAADGSCACLGIRARDQPSANTNAGGRAGGRVEMRITIPLAPGSPYAEPMRVAPSESGAGAGSGAGASGRTQPSVVRPTLEFSEAHHASFMTLLTRTESIGITVAATWATLHPALERAGAEWAASGRGTLSRPMKDIHHLAIPSSLLERAFTARWLPGDGHATAMGCMVYMALRMVVVHDNLFRVRCATETRVVQRAVEESAYILRSAGLLPRRWRRADYFDTQPTS